MIVGSAFDCTLQLGIGFKGSQSVEFSATGICSGFFLDISVARNRV